MFRLIDDCDLGFTIDVNRQEQYPPDLDRRGWYLTGVPKERYPMTEAVHHPGEILAQRLEAVGVSPTELARQVRVPANRITQIIHGQRGITGDSALRLAHWFGDDPELWMKLQARYDLEIAEAETGQEIHGLPIFMPNALAAQGRPVGAQKTRRRVT